MQNASYDSDDLRQEYINVIHAIKSEFRRYEENKLYYPEFEQRKVELLIERQRYTDPDWAAALQQRLEFLEKRILKTRQQLAKDFQHLREVKARFEAAQLSQHVTEPFDEPDPLFSDDYMPELPPIDVKDILDKWPEQPPRPAMRLYKSPPIPPRPQLLREIRICKRELREHEELFYKIYDLCAPLNEKYNKAKAAAEKKSKGNIRMYNNRQKLLKDANRKLNENYKLLHLAGQKKDNVKEHLDELKGMLKKTQKPTAIPVVTDLLTAKRTFDVAPNRGTYNASPDRRTYNASPDRRTYNASPDRRTYHASPDQKSFELPTEAQTRHTTFETSAANRTFDIASHRKTFGGTSGAQERGESFKRKFNVDDQAGPSNRSRSALVETPGTTSSSASNETFVKSPTAGRSALSSLSEDSQALVADASNVLDHYKRELERAGQNLKRANVFHGSLEERLNNEVRSGSKKRINFFVHELEAMGKTLSAIQENYSRVLQRTKTAAKMKNKRNRNLQNDHKSKIPVATSKLSYRPRRTLTNILNAKMTRHQAMPNLVFE